MNTHWCPWCGDSALVIVEGEVCPELRCARCNEPRGQAITQSTLRPALTSRALPIPRARRAHAITSVAGDFYLDKAPVMDVEVLADLSRKGLHDLWRRQWDGHDFVKFVDLAPLLGATWDDDHYFVLLEREVLEARSPSELLQQVERLFITLRHAIAAGDRFEPTEVYDAGTNIFGCCEGCGAWPGGAHMLSECATCPTDRFGRPLQFWGWWSPFIDPARSPDGDRIALLVRVAGHALHAMARAVESNRTGFRIVLALRAWRRALVALPPAMPRVQASLFDVLEEEPHLAGLLEALAEQDDVQAELLGEDLDDEEGEDLDDDEDFDQAELLALSIARQLLEERLP